MARTHLILGITIAITIASAPLYAMDTPAGSPSHVTADGASIKDDSRPVQTSFVGFLGTLRAVTSSDKRFSIFGRNIPNIAKFYGLQRLYPDLHLVASNASDRRFVICTKTTDMSLLNQDSNSTDFTIKSSQSGVKDHLSVPLMLILSTQAGYEYEKKDLFDKKANHLICITNSTRNPLSLLDDKWQPLPVDCIRFERME